MITVHVTQEDIDNAIPENGMWCPIARALKREHGLSDEIIVTNRVVLREFFGTPLYRLSHAAQRFISAFDSHRPVKPSTFQFKEGSPFTTEKRKAT